MIIIHYYINIMGSIFSSVNENKNIKTFKVIIIHRYTKPTPPGWITGGRIEFTTNSAGNPTIKTLLRNINEYRSPTQQIKHLYDEHGNILSAGIPAEDSPFYI
jgi:hypothetical protein